VPGRVAAAHRAAFDVWTEAGSIRSRLPGRLMHDRLDVAVGDWVRPPRRLDPECPAAPQRHRPQCAFRPAAPAHGQTLAANVDVAFVVSSLGPDLEPRRIERYLVTIWESGANPEIVLTKADRLDDPWPLVAEVEAVAVGVPVHVVSAVTGDGLRRAPCPHSLPARRPSCSARPASASPRSSNLWLGEEVMVTRETRDDDDEGRHTTTHRQLLELPAAGS
jgi:ribosome biogenesis GTPase